MVAEPLRGGVDVIGDRASFEPQVAHDVRDPAAWLLGDRASYVTGTALPVDGGMVAVRG
ncbi:hypothetical protein [Streptosporangium canum]|uniref:hypothetical protein n=1 Tax=Streptosporangium canum TaxID=324952 RepID=UPI0031841E28